MDIKKNMQFLGKRILVVTAHPDDESYAAAGAIYQNFQQGGMTFVVCATLGEKGRSHLKKPVTDSQLKKIRKAELLKAAKLLKVKKTFILGYPDGQVKRYRKELLKDVLKIATKIKPEIILSFGQDGVTGHEDHIASGWAARQAARKINARFVSFALPPKFYNKARAWLKARRHARHYRDEVNYTKPNLSIFIDGQIKKKVLAQHRSQMDGGSAFTGFPKFAVGELLKKEYFIYH